MHAIVYNDEPFLLINPVCCGDSVGRRRSDKGCTISGDDRLVAGPTVRDVETATGTAMHDACVDRGCLPIVFPGPGRTVRYTHHPVAHKRAVVRTLKASLLQQ